MKKLESPLTELKKKIITEIKILQEIKNIQNSLNNAKGEEKKELLSHIKSLEAYLKKTKNSIIIFLEGMKINPALPKIEFIQQPETAGPEFIQESPGESLKEVERDDDEDEEYSRDEFSAIEKETLKRLKKKEEKIIEKKAKKPSSYVKNASKMFADYARKLIKKGYFKSLEKDLIRANLEYVLAGYISLIFYTALWSILVGGILTAFFLFFNISSKLPIITFVTDNILSRFLKVFWILFIIPAITFLAMYFYPSLEKRSEEMKINRELPFAVIHMAAISGSMIDPTKIFKIIIETHEYPAISREFTKLLNQINIYGYDLIGGLRNMAFNSPSRKLADLFNSLATAITSGGDLPDFFDKRANSLLFEHRLEKEKEAKAAETFMDIYISVVIAAPMILMLLLMMLKIGGLGIGLSTGTITLTMILGVVVINIFFLTFLHLKQPGE